MDEAQEHPQIGNNRWGYLFSRFSSSWGKVTIIPMK
jgi:hypothetical protein